MRLGREVATVSCAMVMVAGMGELIVIGVMLPFQKHIFGNTASRPLMLGILLITTASVFRRVGGCLSHAEVSSALGADMVKHAACTTMLALQVEPRPGWAAVPFGIGAPVAAAFPELATSAFPVAEKSAVAMGGQVLSWLARSRG